MRSISFLFMIKFNNVCKFGFKIMVKFNMKKLWNTLARFAIFQPISMKYIIYLKTFMNITFINWRIYPMKKIQSFVFNLNIDLCSLFEDVLKSQEETLFYFLN